MSETNMTRDEILALKPGKELDALVAEKVMGWILPPRSSVVGQMWVETPMGRVHPEGLHNWSTDIPAAWEVVEKFDNVTFRCGREADGHIRHSAYIWLMDVINAPLIMYKADTMPEAICKAALLAMEDKPHA